MPYLKLSSMLRLALSVAFVATVSSSLFAATTKTLHNFGLYPGDGGGPNGPLVMDNLGNLYGTTGSGGAYNQGTVFELTPNGSGGWSEKVLYSFGVKDTDGTEPSSGLVLDSAGNLYGTTVGGGAASAGGTAFELINHNGSWIEKKLHNFGAFDDGENPQCQLAFDSAGNLYGTTTGGGDYGFGTVFELTPKGDGTWSEKKLHNFQFYPDGAMPFAGLTVDNAGNLFGTTFAGGDYGAGVAFEMMPNVNGGWTLKKLHNFGSHDDGKGPYSRLIFDAGSNLYGTTLDGGDYPCNSSGCGTAFILSPNDDGTWTETKLHNFGAYRTDGENPFSGLALDFHGNLYGTTGLGGNYGVGTVYTLVPNGNGGWTETKLSNSVVDPLPSLILDDAGNVYGVAAAGGPYNQGVVFEVIP